MVGQGAIRAGRAFVELFVIDKGLEKGLRAAQYKLRRFGGTVRALGMQILGIGAALGTPLLGAIKQAMNAAEGLNRFEQVFGRQAEAARQWADDMAEAIGRSKYEIYDALGTFQGFFRGLGFGGGQAREMSQKLEGLALDFASFNNLADAEAVGRFISALSGSGEVLDRFGINIKQAALQEELLAMGVKKAWTQVSEQEKAMARLNIIARSMGDQGALGDAARTVGSLTNRWKAFKAQVREVAIAVGTQLIPTVTPLVSRMAEWLKANKDLIASKALLIAKLAASTIAAGAALVAVGQLGLGVASLTGAVGYLVKALTVLAAHPVVAAIAILGAATVGVAYAMDRAQRHTAELCDEMADLLRVGDERRAQDVAALGRLEQLSAKERLNNVEMEEARGLIDRLNGRYGDLGATLDETAGSLDGVAAAQRRVNEAMRAAARAEVEAELTELDNNLKELRRERKALLEARDSLLGAITDWAPLPGVQKSEGLEEVQRIGREMDVMFQKRQAAFLRLKALSGGDAAALTGGALVPGAADETGALVPGAADETGAPAALARERESIEQRAHKRVVEARLRGIENEMTAEMSLVAYRYQQEIEEAERVGAATADIYEARQREMYSVWQGFQARKEQEERRAIERRTAFEQQTTESIQDLMVDALMPEGLDRELAHLYLEMQRALAEATDVGADTGLVQQEFQLRADAMARGLESAMSSRVTFSGEAAWGLGAGGGQMDQLVQIERQSRDYLQRLLSDFYPTYT